MQAILNIDSYRLLKVVFGNYWPEAWVCWKSNMKGKKVKDLRNGDLPQTEDCYFCPALLKDGAKGRTLENVKSVHALVIDDVGTKVPADSFMFAPEPTWTIETSPGNFHYGYAIRGGVPLGAFKEFRQAMKTHPSWGKSDGIDAVHLFRLPQGINTKNGWKVVSC